MNVGSAGTRPLGTGLPAVEVVSAWRRGRSTGSVGKPRTRSGDEPGHREGPQLTVEAVEQRNVLEMYGRYQPTHRRFTLLAKSVNRANQAVNGEPVASKGCTAGSERGMGKHAGRKAGRCALSLLYGVAAGWATAPPTITWARLW